MLIVTSNFLFFFYSHAIAMYLADKYGKDDSLYPKDLKNRAIVNQRLFFDSTVLFSRMRSVTVSTLIKLCIQLVT